MKRSVRELEAEIQGLKAEIVRLRAENEVLGNTVYEAWEEVKRLRRRLEEQK